MATAETILKVKNIILSEKQRKVVVVSAPGKQTKGDTKITDLILAGEYEKVKARFNLITKELGIKKINPFRKSQSLNHSVSRGEYFAAKVLSQLLGYEFVDAKTLFVYRNNAWHASKSGFHRIKQLLENGRGVVVPGFYGRCANGKVKTFDRGGSDITGAMLAFYLELPTYEVFTDVDGVYDKDFKVYDKLTYEQMEKIVSTGAEVLHPAAIKYAKKSNITTIIKNTFNPKTRGTHLTV